MKTIKDWFEELPEPYRSEAINNIRKSEANSLSDALDIGFDWGRTKQGYEYWYKLFEKLEQDLKK